MQRSELDAEAKSKSDALTNKEAAIKAHEGIVLTLTDR